MIIRKDTWHYRVYEFTCLDKTPPTTTLCRYVNRVLWLTIPLLILYLIALVTIIALLFLRNAFMVLSGSGYSWFNDSTDALFKDHPFPDLTTRDRQIPLTWVAAIGWAVFSVAFLGWLFYEVARYASAHLAATEMITQIIIAVVALCLMIVGIIYGLKRFRRSESWKLVKAHFKARSKGLCPVLTFEDVSATPEG